MSDWYILDENKNTVRVSDPLIWSKWRDKSGKAWVVRQEECNGFWVSTVFLGLDHSHGGGPPMLFETMVFPSRGNLIEKHCERCSTWTQAEQQHVNVISKILKGEIERD